MKLVNDDDKAMECRELKPATLGMLSPERLRILQLLAEQARYPAEVARELQLPVQTVYYHIRLLEQAGFLKFVEYAERQGGVGKKYSCTAESFAVVVNPEKWKTFTRIKREIPALLTPFVHGGVFRGRMVVGSPDPHGKYRARASELGVLELAMLLGQYATVEFPLYILDTQVKDNDRKGNLILAGGPKVNTLVAEVNERLPIRFDQKNFEVYSTLSKKRYGENIGVIQLVPNPFSSSKSWDRSVDPKLVEVSKTSRSAKMLMVSGLNYHGTRAAVLALVERMKELEKGNTYAPEVMARVVEGFDEDGDGSVDAVEIRE